VCVWVCMGVCVCVCVCVCVQREACTTCGSAWTTQTHTRRPYGGSIGNTAMKSKGGLCVRVCVFVRGVRVCVCVCVCVCV